MGVCGRCKSRRLCCFCICLVVACCCYVQSRLLTQSHTKAAGKVPNNFNNSNCCRPSCSLMNVSACVDNLKSKHEALKTREEEYLKIEKERVNEVISNAADCLSMHVSSEASHIPTSFSLFSPSRQCAGATSHHLATLQLLDPGTPSCVLTHIWELRGASCM